MRRGLRPLERDVLRTVTGVARRRFRVDARYYVLAVGHRLELGAQRYGDDAYLDRDNLAELLEETPDVAGYALLELQRLQATARLTDTVRDDLLRVALLGAVADFYARRARRHRDEARR